MDEIVHKQTFNIDQCPTVNVTLYPSRATIERKIDAVKLKPGLNEITTSDITSHADPDTVRVSGTTDNHSARINDLIVDLVPNKYSTLSTLPDAESEDSDDESDSTNHPISLKDARDEKDRISEEIAKVKERSSSANDELALLKQYATSLTSSPGVNTTASAMKDALELYTTKRQAHYDTVTICTKQLEGLERDLLKASKRLQMETNKFTRANFVKIEEREKRRADREERRREQRENKPEKLTTVHRVRITVELPWPSDTASAGDVVQDATLYLTYATSAASWSPHYDLRLSTVDPTLSTLTYRAHFINGTFERWENARLTLSTTQASFGGLGEEIPRMESWRIMSCKKNTYMTEINQFGQGGLYSLAERKAIEEDRRMKDSWTDKKSEKVGNTLTKGLAGKVGFLHTEPAGGVKRGRFFDNYDPTIEDSYDELVDGTVIPEPKPMSQAASSSETYGFTTSYELPTPRTILSSPLVRRHVIAEIELPSLSFTHILIPKLKAAAFLKAKLTNTSNIPLLPGKAGLTLDGSFMGNLSFPRASPTEEVMLALGVDQGVKVEYEKPTVKHGTQGILIGKEEVVVFDQVPVSDSDKLKVHVLLPRGLKEVGDTVKNVGIDGKANNVSKQADQGPTTKQILEDIPETSSIQGSVRRLTFSKRDSIQKTLSETASTISKQAFPPSSSLTGWGTAKATLRKKGEIRWDVELSKGGCANLRLDWECRMPGGEGIRGMS